MSLSPRILNIIKQAGEQVLKEIEKEITPQPQEEKADRFDKTEGSCYDKPQEREEDLRRQLYETDQKFRKVKEKADKWDSLITFFMEKGWDVDCGMPLKEWIAQRLVSGQGDRVMPEETYQRLSGIQAQFNLMAANKTEEMLKVHEALRSIINKSTGGKFTEFATTGRLIEVAINTVEAMRDLGNHYKKTFDNIISKGDEFLPKSEISEARSARAEAVVEKLYSLATEPRMTQEAHERGVAHVVEAEVEKAKRSAEGLLSSLAQNFFIRAGGAETMGKYDGNEDPVVTIKACFTQMERAKEVAERDLGRRTHGNTYPWCDVHRDHHVIEIEHKKGSILRFLNINGGVEDRTKDVAARLRATADEMDPPANTSSVVSLSTEHGVRATIRLPDEDRVEMMAIARHEFLMNEVISDYKKKLATITLEVGKAFALATDFAKADEQAVTHVSAAIFNHKKIVGQLWERVHAAEKEKEQAILEIREKLENVVVVGPGWKDEVKVTIGPNHATATVEMGHDATIKNLMFQVEKLEAEVKHVTEQKSLGGWIAGEEHQKVVDEVALLKQTYNQLFDGYKILETEHAALKAEAEKAARLIKLVSDSLGSEVGHDMTREERRNLHLWAYQTLIGKGSKDVDKMESKEKERQRIVYENMIDRSLRLQKVRKLTSEVLESHGEDLGLVAFFLPIQDAVNQQNTKEEIQGAIQAVEAELKNLMEPT